MSSNKVIVVGGGLAGLSAAHTVLERGGKVVIIDKNPFLGGNSTKATSGINGALTNTQIGLGIKDSAEAFYEDTARSARDLIRPPLVKVLTHNSGSAVEWLKSIRARSIARISTWRTLIPSNSQRKGEIPWYDYHLCSHGEA